MKLFVWHGVLCDYTQGIAFAMAETEEQARKLASEGFERDYMRGVFGTPPEDTEFWTGVARAAIDGREPETHEEAYGTGIMGGG